jgi:hypothetical protein
MATRPFIVGRTLAAFGIVLYIAGAAFCLGLLFGFFRTFPYAGVVAMLAGNTIGWFGNSLAAGTVKQEIKETLKYEASDTLRLRTRVRPVSAVLIVTGFMLVAAAGVLVWWVLSQHDT